MTAYIFDFQKARQDKLLADRECASPGQSDHRDKTECESRPSLYDSLFGSGKTPKLYIEKSSPVFVMSGCEPRSEEEMKKRIKRLRLHPKEVLEMVEVSTGKVLDYS